MQRSILIAHPSADLYGSDRVMLETVEAMSERGWQVVVTLPATGPLVAEIEQRHGKVVLCPSPVLRKAALRPAGMVKLVVEVLRSLPQCIRLISRTKPDVVYVSTLTIPLWLPLARLMGKRTVCHVHESERSASLLVRRALALPLLFAHRVLVNSRFSQAVLTESFSILERRSEVIYNGVAGPSEVRMGRETLTDPSRLLFVGRLAPRKGPQVAIEVVRVLSDRGLDVKLELVGAVYPGYEWFEEELRSQVAEHDLKDRVIFHGFAEDVWPHVEAADIVLVPSQGDEPFGNTAVEAVLAARPVVVSASSGLDEAVAGYLSAQSVPADGVEQWADAVTSVLSHWPEFREQARKDTDVAQQRHAPARYRETVSQRLAALARA